MALDFKNQNKFQVKRLNSTSARTWALKNIPLLTREALLNHASILLSDQSVEKFWSILYSPQLYHVCIPAVLEDKSRQTIGKGASINHVDGILDIFDPPPLWTNMVFWPIPLENHVAFLESPLPPTIAIFWIF